MAEVAERDGYPCLIQEVICNEVQEVSTDAQES
jgi:hypothetical protein